MKKLSKAILIALGTLVALAGAAIVGANLYLQSPGVQARIQEEIGRALRIPLRITNSSINPWGDLSISGITIPDGDTNFLEAAAFRARYRIPPIFTGKLVIYDLRVENPKIVWTQNAEGKWVLPKRETPAAPSPAAPESTPAKPEPAKPEPRKRGGFQVTVDGFEILRGNVELRDHAGQRVAGFTDVNLRCSTLSREHIEGTAAIARAEWAGVLKMEAVNTPFVYTPATLDFPQFAGKLAGGSVTGSFKVRHAEPKSPFETALKFDQVDIARIAADADWNEGQTTGSAAGTLDLHGTFSEFARSEGHVNVTLRDGRFREFGYFEMIGQALQIKQLSDLSLKESTAAARIADEKLFFENISLEAADLRLNAKGIARFDGKLQLAARLTADESLLRQLPGLVRDNFTPAENATRSIDFNVTGKTSKPKTDLLDKIVGKKLEEQFDDLVSSLFGGKKKKDDEKKDKKKKKKDEPEGGEPKAAEPAAALQNPAAPALAPQ